MIFDTVFKYLSGATGNQSGYYKIKISGTVQTEEYPENKFLYLFDRRTGELIGISRPQADGTFKVYGKSIPDENLLFVGIDLTNTYNSDTYDRLSFCSDEMEIIEGPSWKPIRLQGEKIWTSANFAIDGVLTHLAVNASATGLETSGANVGTWVSSAILLTKYNADALYNNRLQYAKLGWCYPIGSPSVDYSTVYKGYVSLEGGTKWTDRKITRLNSR